MFEVIKVTTFQKDEYRVYGDEKYVYLEWTYPDHKPELLYFHKLEDDGVRNVMLHLAHEIKELAFEPKMLARHDDFDFKAEVGCRKISYES